MIASLDRMRAWDIARRALRHPLFQAAMVLVLYTQTRRDVWGSLSRVPANAFQGEFALLAALEVPLVSFTLALSLLFGVASWKLDYGSLREGRWVRVFIGAIVIAQAWTCVFQESNLYFDRLHLPDRLVIAALAAASLWRPGFVPMFLAATMVFMGQSAAVLSSLGWTNMRFLLDALMLTSSWLVIRRVLGADAHVLVVTMLVVAGATYFVPGLDKLSLGPAWHSWVLEDDLGNFFVAAWLNGWLPSLDEATMLHWAGRFSGMSMGMGVVTLAVELGALFMLTRPRVAVALLAGGALLHAGIFVVTGILFWKWIVVDLSLALLLWKAGGLLLENPWWLRIAGTAVIALGVHTMKPQRLAWWDTRYNQVFFVDVVDDKGETYAYPSLEFAPYDMTFTQGRYFYVTTEPKKTGTFGASTSYRVYERLQRATDIDAVEQLFRKHKSSFNEKRARKFDEFMQRWFRNLNAHHGERPLRFIPHVPGHIQVFRRQDGANAPLASRPIKLWSGQHVTAVKVRLVESVYDGSRIHPIRDEVVREIAIDAPRTPPRGARRVADPGTDMVFAGDCVDGPRTTLAFLGDMKLHKPAAQQAMQKGHESLWSGIKDLIGAADVTWANLEGTLACCIDVDEREHADPGMRVDGTVYSASGKGGLNFHPSFAGALKEAGVDVLSTANNHGLDRGGVGVRKTLDVLDAAGLAHTGTRRSAEEPWHTVTNSNGFSIAWLACAEWTNKKKPEWQPFILNCTQQRDAVLQQIRALSNQYDGVIFVPHGGEEERLLPDDRLRGLARDAAEAGALAVFSSHPHNMQTWEKYETQDGREVPLCWGRGNYITFAKGIENVVSTIVYLGVARDAAGKARVSGVVHVPIRLTDGPGDRTLVAIDRESDVHDDARNYVLTRFGATRLHPPTLPIDTQHFCNASAAPARGRVGDVCASDDVCGPELTCVATSKGNGICTQPCRPDGAPCAAASNGPAICALDDGHACRRPCRSNDECTLSTTCVDGSYCAVTER